MDNLPLEGPLALPSISVIILALNEAGNIKKTIDTVTGLLVKQGFSDYELLFLDGGSRDGTQRIVTGLADSDSHIKMIPSPSKRGLGQGFRLGVEAASKEYVGWFPGDNETLPETIQNIFTEIAKNKYDAILPYTVNPWVRSVPRRILSSTYTSVFNILFGLNLKYFNGPCFFRRKILSTIMMSSDSPSYMAEILVQLIKKRSISYVEVPMYIKIRDYGRTSVMQWKNVYLIGKTIMGLIQKVYLSRD